MCLNLTCTKFLAKQEQMAMAYQNPSSTSLISNFGNISNKEEQEGMG
jgi:hypothetical protein